MGNLKFSYGFQICNKTRLICTFKGKNVLISDGTLMARERLCRDVRMTSISRLQRISSCLRTVFIDSMQITGYLAITWTITNRIQTYTRIDTHIQKHSDTPQIRANMTCYQSSEVTLSLSSTVQEIQPNLNAKLLEIQTSFL